MTSSEVKASFRGGQPTCPPFRPIRIKRMRAENLGAAHKSARWTAAHGGHCYSTRCDPSARRRLSTRRGPHLRRALARVGICRSGPAGTAENALLVPEGRRAGSGPAATDLPVRASGARGRRLDPAHRGAVADGASGQVDRRDAHEAVDDAAEGLRLAEVESHDPGDEVELREGDETPVEPPIATSAPARILSGFIGNLPWLVYGTCVERASVVVTRRWQEDAVDDVDHAVGGVHVRLHDPRVVDLHRRGA